MNISPAMLASLAAGLRQRGVPLPGKTGPMSTMPVGPGSGADPFGGGPTTMPVGPGAGLDPFGGGPTTSPVPFPPELLGPIFNPPPGQLPRGLLPRSDAVPPASVSPVSPEMFGPIPNFPQVPGTRPPLQRPDPAFGGPTTSPVSGGDYGPTQTFPQALARRRALGRGRPRRGF